MKKNQQFCRVCEESIGLMGWKNHVSKHKKEYARKFGLSEENAWEITWENVVKVFNPSRVRVKKEMQKPEPKPQKQITQYF